MRTLDGRGAEAHWGAPAGIGVPQDVASVAAFLAPTVPTVFRTLLRHVQQQYSSTRGRLSRSACGL